MRFLPSGSLLGGCTDRGCRPGGRRALPDRTLNDSATCASLKQGALLLVSAERSQAMAPEPDRRLRAIPCSSWTPAPSASASGGREATRCVVRVTLIRPRTTQYDLDDIPHTGVINYVLVRELEIFSTPSRPACGWSPPAAILDRPEQADDAATVKRPRQLATSVSIARPCW